MNKDWRITGNDKETALALQRLCREATKEKLLKDILADIAVCRLEGWDYKEYLLELRDLVNHFIKN